MALTLGWLKKHKAKSLSKSHGEKLSDFVWKNKNNPLNLHPVLRMQQKTNKNR